MGSVIELNDTLKLSKPDFPEELVFERHRKTHFKTEEFKEKVYGFKKQGIRLFNLYPTRVFLVEDINGKWLYWGQAMIIEQTIDALNKTTSGRYKIEVLYDPDFQKQITKKDSPKGKGFFE